MKESQVSIASRRIHGVRPKDYHSASVVCPKDFPRLAFRLRDSQDSKCLISYLFWSFEPLVPSRREYHMLWSSHLSNSLRVGVSYQDHIVLPPLHYPYKVHLPLLDPHGQCFLSVSTRGPLKPNMRRTLPSVHSMNCMPCTCQRCYHLACTPNKCRTRYFL